ncbi:hypothetical protein M8C21_025239 [Ambrosia artemisiifolia]|uniref:Uncharacterized protein n=1 Tax=Ambrosia artemisiifolia TaxID=4212 RepID=A0AAD5C0C2_AMBAR|nr:hypothetical protein M8C21_025239 [Ambrosia artemisiifolia]
MDICCKISFKRFGESVHVQSNLGIIVSANIMVSGKKRTVANDGYESTQVVKKSRIFVIKASLPLNELRTTVRVCYVRVDGGGERWYRLVLYPHLFLDIQDDIIPRLSVATLMILRNVILKIDWGTIFEKDDWRSVVDIVANAKPVVSSVQDVAKKVVDYTKFGRPTTEFIEVPGKKYSVYKTSFLQWFNLHTRSIKI